MDFRNYCLSSILCNLIQPLTWLNCQVQVLLINGKFVPALGILGTTITKEFVHVRKEVAYFSVLERWFPTFIYMINFTCSTCFSGLFAIVSSPILSYRGKTSFSKSAVWRDDYFCSQRRGRLHFWGSICLGINSDLSSRLLL